MTVTKSNTKPLSIPLSLDEIKLIEYRMEKVENQSQQGHQEVMKALKELQESMNNLEKIISRQDERIKVLEDDRKSMRTLLYTVIGAFIIQIILTYLKYVQ